MTFAVEIITLVPDIWKHTLGPGSGLVGKAFDGATASLTVRNLRDFGKGVHKQVDDSPFGGGAGMVLGVEPLHIAIVAARGRTPGPVVLMGPRGKPFGQQDARRFAAGPGLTLICARYEGVDERVRDYVDEEISVGDFVLSAGDPAAWCVVDATIRLLPGVLGNAESLEEESFGQPDALRLEYPHYTRPASYDGKDVPEILRSGDHGAIARWREEQGEELTRRLRPDLLKKSI